MTMRRTSLPKYAWIVSAGLAFAGCAGAGPYGHAPDYVPLGSEREAVARARPYDGRLGGERRPDDAGRSARNADTNSRYPPVALFGVVDVRAVGPGGQALLKLGVRALEPHNVCQRAGDDDSCRVTVSDKDFGVAWALVALRAEDDTGPQAIGQRSLVRLVGTIAEDVSPVDGAPVVHATWYRHWPVRQYLAAGPTRSR
jgi:hypothetical protein